MREQSGNVWVQYFRSLGVGLGAVALIVGIAVLIQWFPEYRVERRFFESVGQLGTWNDLRGAEWLLFWTTLVVSLVVLVGAMLPGFARLFRQSFFAQYVGPIGNVTGMLTGFIAFGFALSARGWAQDFLLWWNGAATGPEDPVFSNPVGFYLTQLPFRADLAGGVRGLLIVSIILGVIVWTAAHLARQLLTMYQVSSSGGPSHPGASVSGDGLQTLRSMPPRFWALIALYLGIYQLVTTFFIYWYERPNLLFEIESIVAGPGERMTTIDIPGQLVSIGLHAVVAVVLIGLAVVRRAEPRYILGAMAVPVVLAIAIPIVGSAYGYFSIRPNELSAQGTYIDRTVQWTRQGYGLSGIDEREFEQAPSGITEEDLNTDSETIEKIRVADPQAFHQAIEQLQEVRGFYQMYTPDVDRYMIDGELQQVLLSARGIVPDDLPPSIANNFVQRRLQFTHGYGVVAAPAQWSTQPETGEPQLLAQNIPVEVSQGFPEVTQPRLYLGEQIPPGDWVVVNTGVDEFDHPSPQATDAENRYQGPDGIEIGGGLSRLLMMARFSSLKLWTSEYINDDSRIMIHRNPLDRVRTLAPMFQWDSDPLLMIRDDGSLAYVVNGMSHSRYYPYSRVNSGDNYRRNSLKAIVDAYTGEVTIHVIDEEDPITAAYRKAMPDLFTSEPLPDDVERHMQYPNDLFSWQAQAYQIYHTEDVDTIYRGTDRWRIDQEQAFNWSTGTQIEQTMDPYWVLSRIPGQEDIHYRTILGFSVEGRRPLAGWMTVNNDTYELTAFKLPRGSQTMGSAQFEALVNANPSISEQISLWDQQGSSVVRGATVITPVNTGFLYVEPIYLIGSGSPIPQLVRVVAGTQNRVAWGNDLDAALDNLLEAPEMAVPPEGEPGAPGTPVPGTPVPAPGTGTPPAEPLPSPTIGAPSDVPADLSTLSNQELSTLANQLYTDARSAEDFQARGRALDELGRVIEELSRRNQSQ